MPGETGESSLRALLEYLRTARGFDFSAYKPATLTRRIAKRLQAAGSADYREYTDYLEVHPEEFTRLFNTILINVTSFFRDAQAWDFLRREVIPGMLAGKGEDAAIRIWSAGCSSGEEAYSLAISFCDALGPAAFQRRVKIYATDIDEEALIQARQGRYARKDLEAVPKEWRETYFEPGSRRFVVRTDIRRAVVFGRHDLLKDAPISRQDLIVCRNTLMYFNAETQAQVLNRLHFALNDGGFLFLGKAEMALASTGLFAPVEMRLRIFSKAPAINPADKPLLPAQPAEPPEMSAAMRRSLLRAAALEAAPSAQVVVDSEGRVAAANHKAQAMFGLGVKDLEQPFQNVELSYNPAELRLPIQKALRERQSVTLRDVVFSTKEGASLYLDIEVRPLFAAEGSVLGVSLAFIDASPSHQLSAEIEKARQEQETSGEELQSSNEELQTTNEELQSTVEELQTTNEELQSTNEEMETMNEELRSTNEELRAANEQLRNRTEELDQASGFAESLLSNVSVAIIAVDPRLRITVWNRTAKSMWGLDADEVNGKPLLELEIGLPMDKLAEPVRSAVAERGTAQKVLLDAVDRKGKPFRCRINITPSTGANRDSLGAVLVMEED